MYVKNVTPEEMAEAMEKLDAIYHSPFTLTAKSVGYKRYLVHLKPVSTYSPGHAHSGIKGVHKGRVCGHVLQHFLNFLPDTARVYWKAHDHWNGNPAHGYATMHGLSASSLESREYGDSTVDHPCHCKGTPADLDHYADKDAMIPFVPLVLPDGTTHPLDTQENFNKYKKLQIGGGCKKCPGCGNYHVHAEPDEVEYAVNVIDAKAKAAKAEEIKKIHASMGPLKLDEDGFKFCHNCKTFHLIPTNEEMDEWLKKQEVKP